jgi:aquaporin Z
MHNSLDTLLRRVRDEFVEMPGLSLTEGQASRLWQVDPMTAADLLRRLVEARFLARTGVMAGHWREYAAEALALGLFMVSAMLCTVALEHPASALRASLPDAFTRRVVMGLAMGATAAAIIYSPLGARSGAHMNPSVTLAFLWLGRVSRRDAAGYIAAQVIGAIAGTALSAAIVAPLAAAPKVNFVRTLPGPGGVAPAILGELVISFLTLSILLAVSARPSTMRATGLVAGCVVMANITFEAPLSGMSMNPARSFGPALVAGDFSFLWIYLAAPPIGMWLAARWHHGRATARPGSCAKFNHSSRVTCIFCEA